MRQKENLSWVGFHKNVLVLHVIRCDDEIRAPSELTLPSTKVSKKEVDMALKLSENYTEPVKLDKYKDDYNKQLMKIIKFFFSSRRRHTRSLRDWSSDVCSSD